MDNLSAGDIGAIVGVLVFIVFLAYQLISANKKNSGGKPGGKPGGQRRK